MEQGSNQRATSSTRLNELSSRSHAVFMLIAEQSEVVVSEENEGTFPFPFSSPFPRPALLSLLSTLFLKYTED